MKPDMVILAAGMGRRFGGLKQFSPVGPGGESILDYSLFDALRAGFGRFVFIIRPEIEDDFDAFIAGKLDGQADVVKVYQQLDQPPVDAPTADRTKPWGTGHAVLVARDVLDKPFGVINADDFYGAEAYRLLADLLAEPQPSDVPQYGMVGFRLGETLSDHGPVSRGVCECNADSFLTNVTERTKIERADENHARFMDEDGREQMISTDATVSMNFWGFTPTLLDALHEKFVRFMKDRGAEPGAEFFLPQVVTELIDEGRARTKVSQTGSTWFGLTYPEDRDAVVQSLRDLVDAGVYPERLWA